MISNNESGIDTALLEESSHSKDAGLGSTEADVIRQEPACGSDQSALPGFWDIDPKDVPVDLVVIRSSN